MNTIKVTKTQQTILERTSKKGYLGAAYYPVYGSGEHRSARSLECKGIATMASLQPFHNSFLVLEPGYNYNYLTQSIEEAA